ncbi:GNAT family N-acetyltransferase [Paenibacillus sp. LjRoot56]|uniref:GNAT family N-acetyltransferase n=1 Tax=Paenibacillus sp. LjRoot56 TaxID=3342333 RepID=UPI003ECCF58B
MQVSGLIVRTMTEEDLPFAMELKNIAGWNQVENDWRGYMRFAKYGCFLAEMGGEKAGTATAIPFENRFGWIGMVLVHPSQRRFGIGTALLQKTIAFLEDHGVDCIKLDATQMGKKVYIPLGFQDEYEVTRYQGKAPKLPLQRLVTDLSAKPLKLGSLDEIIAFDAHCFGANREEIIRTLYKRHEELAFYIKQDGVVIGYLLARVGFDAVQIGPWAAVNDMVAEVLFIEVLRSIPDRGIFLDVPKPNVSGTALMKKYGFEEQRGFWRMFLGENRYPGHPEHIYGTSGAEKG